MVVVAADDLRPSAAAVREVEVVGIALEAVWVEAALAVAADDRAVEVEVEDKLSEFELRGGRILLRNELPLPPSLLDSSGGRGVGTPRPKGGEGCGGTARIGSDGRGWTGLADALAFSC